MFEHVVPLVCSFIHMYMCPNSQLMIAGGRVSDLAGGRDVHVKGVVRIWEIALINLIVAIPKP